MQRPSGIYSASSQPFFACELIKGSVHPFPVWALSNKTGGDGGGAEVALIQCILRNGQSRHLDHIERHKEQSGCVPQIPGCGLFLTTGDHAIVGTEPYYIITKPSQVRSRAGIASDADTCNGPSSRNEWSFFGTRDLSSTVWLASWHARPSKQCTSPHSRLGLYTDLFLET